MKVSATLAVLLVIVTASISAVSADPYVIQGEGIIASADWVNKVGPGGTVATDSGNVSDGGASGLFALHVLDADSTTAGQWIRTTTAAGAFGGSATTVFRLKTAPASSPAYGGTVYARSVILSFVQDGARTRRAVALAFRPDKLAVATTTSAVVGGAELFADNTSYHVYTIVARDFGYNFDVYRDGVKIFDNIANNSASESSIGGTAGLDAVSVGSSIGNARTDVYLDWIGYRAGEYPSWVPVNPVPEPGSIVILASGLATFAASRLRKRQV